MQEMETPLRSVVSKNSKQHAISQTAKQNEAFQWQLSGVLENNPSDRSKEIHNKMGEYFNERSNKFMKFIDNPEKKVADYNPNPEYSANCSESETESAIEVAGNGSYVD